MSSREEVQEIAEFARLRQDHGVELIEVDRGHSIGLYFYCPTYEALRHLYELLLSLDLQRIVETIFCSILKSNEKIKLTIEFRKDDYMKCLAYLNIGKFNLH